MKSSRMRDRITDAIYELGFELCDSDEIITGLMAETNGGCFSIDSVELSMCSQVSRTEFDFTAEIRISASEHRDAPWCGDSIDASLSGKYVLDQDSWSIQDYNVFAAEIDRDRGPSVYP